MKKLNFFIFGEPGLYDEFNPRYILENNKLHEIIYTIAEGTAFLFGVAELENLLAIDKKGLIDMISKLKRIGAIKVNEQGRFAINFTLFLAKDIDNIQEYLKYAGKRIGDRILSLGKEIKNIIEEEQITLNEVLMKRKLYHVICDYTFDGVALDYFSKKGLFKVSKVNEGNRDYILYAYEDDSVLNKFSNKLLCSSNNVQIDGYRFNSFGDCDGNRNDLFRYLRRVDREINNIQNAGELNSAYTKWVSKRNNELAKELGDYIINLAKGLIHGNESKYEDLFNIGKALGYLDLLEKGKVSINVPIFTENHEEVFNKVGEYISSEIYDELKEILKEMSERLENITAIRHGVDIKEIALELWHLIFGSINEYLVEKGFVDKPYYSEFEGRYLQSIYMLKSEGGNQNENN
ncbi:hypothetical protein [Oceanirhabdus sp. W0125-5]|uniref:hypothetical protein n=1 Tax=Oceanirhabdus sp. W0125-5 TaxID=2999116 RepID=UPI0022F2C544|nr:hypothetical protein [Oceanirhabdus sp. W0125-5]WBW99234.1 hypothetical protein OW730_10930 [Oceanirhabdus sp. W0125-5]